jgi:hypothetical protein
VILVQGVHEKLSVCVLAPVENERSHKHDLQQHLRATDAGRFALLHCMKNLTTNNLLVHPIGALEEIDRGFDAIIGKRIKAEKIAAPDNIYATQHKGGNQDFSKIAFKICLIEYVIFYSRFVILTQEK